MEDSIAAYKIAMELTPDFDCTYSNYLFCLLHSEGRSVSEIFAEHCRYSERYEMPLAAQRLPHANGKDPERHLQIGFISADLVHHAVVAFIEPVLEFLARSPRVTVHVYDNSVVEDGVGNRDGQGWSHVPRCDRFA